MILAAEALVEKIGCVAASEAMTLSRLAHREEVRASREGDAARAKLLGGGSASQVAWYTVVVSMVCLSQSYPVYLCNPVMKSREGDTVDVSS